MNTNPLKNGVLTENSAGIGAITRQMVRERAVELAIINERSAARTCQKPIGNRPNGN